MGAIRLRVVTEAVRVGEMPGDVSSNLGEYRGRFDTWGHLTLKPTAGVSHPLCRHGFRLTSSQAPVSHLALLSLSHHPFSLPSFPPIFLVSAQFLLRLRSPCTHLTPASFLGLLPPDLVLLLEWSSSRCHLPSVFLCFFASSPQSYLVFFGGFYNGNLYLYIFISVPLSLRDSCFHRRPGPALRQGPHCWPLLLPPAPSELSTWQVCPSVTGFVTVFLVSSRDVPGKSSLFPHKAPVW